MIVGVCARIGRGFPLENVREVARSFQRIIFAQKCPSFKSICGIESIEFFSMFYAVKKVAALNIADRHNA
jgi:hypothetical protein